MNRYNRGKQPDGRRTRGVARGERAGRLPARFVHGVALPSNWADRSMEVERLGVLLQCPDVRVVNVVGIGGIGKTSVMRKVADRVAGESGYFDSMLWFSFYRDDDVERFFLEACRYLVPEFDPVAYVSTFERASALQSAIGQRPTLFVLDGFERIVSAGAGSPPWGRISRREIASFLSYVLASRSAATVALTSRVRLDEFSGLDGFVEEELPDLRLAAAVGFLRSGGLCAPERFLTRVAMAYGCHVLALAVYVDYVRHRSLEDDISRVDVPLVFPAESTLSDRLGGLLAHYYQHLDNPERLILSLISASPRGLEIGELRALTLARLADKGGKEKSARGSGVPLRRLNSSVLVTENHDGDIIRYDSHPVVKAFCYDQLSADEQYLFHQELLALARKRPVPADPAAIDEIQPLLNIFWHAMAMGDNETAFSVWLDKRVYRRLLWWGSFHAALDLVDRLISAPAMRTRPARAAKGRLLGEAGILLVKLGRPHEALAAYEEGVAHLDSDPARALKVLLDLSEAQMEVGIYLDAEKTLRHAEILHCQVPDFPSYKLIGRRGQLAAVLSPLDHAEEILAEALRQAIDAEKDCAPGYTCLFLRTRADLRCSHGSLDQAQADYEAALKHATDPRWRFVDYEGHVRRGLGDLASLKARHREAATHYAAALDVARRIGYTWLEAETFVAKARAALRSGDSDEAQECTLQAHSLAEAGGWVALTAECLLIRAACTGSNAMASRASLRSARSLILKSGKPSLKTEYSKMTGETL